MTIIANDAVAVTPAGEIVTAADVTTELGITPTAAESTIIANCIKEAEGAVRAFLRYDPVQRSHTEYHPQQPLQAQISRGIWEVMEQRAVLRQVSEAATNELQLQHLPVRCPAPGLSTPQELVVKVDYDGRSGAPPPTRFGSATLKTYGQDYWPNVDMLDSLGYGVCRDGILRTIGLWPTTPGTVKIVYTAGYTNNELRGLDSVIDASPIFAAALSEACRRVRRKLTMRKGRAGLLAGLKTSETLGSYSYSLDGASAGFIMGGELAPENKARLGEWVNYGWSLGS